MSKININSETKEFLNNNKVALVTLSIAMITISSVSTYIYKTKEEKKLQNILGTSISQTEDDALIKLKLNVQKNIEHMEIVKNDENKLYHIIENLYDVVPVYGINKNNEQYVVSYEKKQGLSFMEYDISYENAIKLGIDELLDSKVVGNSKVKK